MDNSSKLIEKIKQENIKPLPRWLFRLKNMAALSVFVLAVILGAIAFSVVLFAIQQIDFNLVVHMRHSWFEMLLGLLPFFWIISLIISLIAAIVGIKNSKKGYKFSSLKLVGFSAALSILAGTLFFMGGGAKWLEHAFSTNVSLYESIQEKKAKLWMMPEEGYLSGTILSINDSIFILKDFNDEEWKIEYNDIDMAPVVNFVEGEKIKIMGEMKSAHEFKAKKIRPWGGENRVNENIP
jgi:hypothetical protein